MTREEYDAIAISIGKELQSMTQTRGWGHVLKHLESEIKAKEDTLANLQINAEILGNVASLLGGIRSLRDFKDDIEKKIREGQRLEMASTVKAGR